MVDVWMRPKKWLLVLIAGLAVGITAVGTADWCLASPLRQDPAPVLPTDGSCPLTGPDRSNYPFPAGPATIMVPGTPVSATVCRYGGLNPPEGYRRLEASNSVTDSQLQQLITDLNSVGDNIRPGLLACPYDDARSDLIIFTYQDSQPIYVTVQLLGCGIASNGAARSMLHGYPDSPGERVMSLLAVVTGS
jgi:hypothetical protein